MTNAPTALGVLPFEISGAPGALFLQPVEKSDEARKRLLRIRLAANGTNIFYLASRRIPGHWGRLTRPAKFTLRQVNLISGEDKIVLTPEAGAAYFGAAGALASVGQNRLLILRRYLGNRKQAKIFREQQTFGYYFDVTASNLSSVFSRNGLPDPERRSLPIVWSLTAARDGKRIAYVAGRMFEEVVLWEDNKETWILNKNEIGVRTISYLAISGDGRHLAVTADPINSPSDQKHIWILDINTKKLAKLALRTPLRASINSRSNKDRAKTR